MDGRPYFVPPFSAEETGVDFLGLRQANLDLVFRFIPGINNVTRYVRPYSMLCWMAWSFARQVRQREEDEFILGDFRRYREKVEILFNWSHKIGGTTRGLVGSDSQPPAGSRADLTFKAWNRNVSWMDAVNYGPSIKADSGLGLVVAPRKGVISVTDEGAELAKALDERLQKSKGYGLFNPRKESAKEADVGKLFEAWNVERPSAKEREVLRRVLFEGGSQAITESAAARAKARSLIEITLERSKTALTPEKVSECLARKLDSAGRTLLVPEPLEAHLGMWRVLQVRQRQRLAHETIFSAIERQILLAGLRRAESLVKVLLEAISSIPQLAMAKNPLLAVEAIRKAGGKHGGILQTGYHDAEFDPIQQAALIEEDLREARYDSLLSDEACARAILTLLECAAATEEFTTDPPMRRYLGVGGRDRISLAFWAGFVREHGGSWQELITNLIEDLLLSQHFATATRRQELGKQRLRIAIEQEGLMPLAKAPWWPVMSPDRMPALMELMADCGVLEKTGGKFALA